MIRGAPTLSVAVLLGAAPAWAQTAQPSFAAIESVAAFEEHVDESRSGTWGLTFDTVVSVSLGSNFQAIARLCAVGSSDEWNRQIQPMTLRYERRGQVAVRVDGGFLPSPIGTSILTNRPHLNPTITQPSYSFAALPLFEPDGTSAQLVSASYPLGALVAVSGGRWDVRTGVIDSSPVRPRRVFSGANPPRFAQLVAGGGISPVFGMRIGAAVAHGGWAASPARSATLVTIEGEYGYRYTKVTAEWVHDAFESAASGALDGEVTASGWHAQVVQTLAPRWFVAGRIERMSLDASVAQNPPLSLVQASQHFTGTEEILGYRVTPEVTIRAGHRAHRTFGRSTWDHEASVSLVWARRWM